MKWISKQNGFKNEKNAVKQGKKDFNDYYKHVMRQPVYNYATFYVSTGETMEALNFHPEELSVSKEFLHFYRHGYCMLCQLLNEFLDMAVRCTAALLCTGGSSVYQEMKACVTEMERIYPVYREKSPFLLAQAEMLLPFTEWMERFFLLRGKTCSAPVFHEMRLSAVYSVSMAEQFYTAAGRMDPGSVEAMDSFMEEKQKHFTGSYYILSHQYPAYVKRGYFNFPVSLAGVIQENQFYILLKENKIPYMEMCHQSGLSDYEGSYILMSDSGDSRYSLKPVVK